MRYEISTTEKKYIQLLILLLTAVVLLRTSWISDDGQITLRSVLNFVHGYGPVLNVGERVQSYTHPLWFLLLSAMAWVHCNIILASFILSLLFSLASCWILTTKISPGFWKGIILGCAAIFSKAFVDYSSSGLENPLTNFLILLAVCLARRTGNATYLRDRSLAIIILALIFLSRPDALLLTAPYVITLLYTLNASPAKKILLALYAAILPAAWTAFSVIYYGFPFANTAYAKLNINAPRKEIILQGFIYLLDSFTKDPLTLSIICLTVAWTLLRPSKETALGIGIILYVAYLSYIGGDFMSGRFLTLPFTASLAVMATQRLSRAMTLLLALMTATFGLITIKSTVLSDSTFGSATIAQTLVTDERGYYFQRFGLINVGRDFFKEPDWNWTGMTSVTSTLPFSCGGLGFDSLHAGPNVHFLDPCGLADPYVAHRQMIAGSLWRPGQLTRFLPPEYKSSVEHGTNQFSASGERSYLDKIWLITRSPDLFSTARLQAIWDINTSGEF